MLRKYLLLVALLLTAVCIASGQHYGMITGRIVDASGQPLAGASVVTDVPGVGVATDNDGNYSLRGLRERQYNLRFSYTGYETYDTLINVKGTIRLDVSLKESLYVAGEVIVRAGRAGTRTPMAYSTVETSELRERDLTRDMPYLLSLTPSLVETSDAGNGIGYTSLRIRGSDASRINITLDGIPLNDAESQQVFWVDLPDLASSTGSIQIQRGVGTSTNGAGAFGASVNISTMTPPDDPGAAADLSFGSFNTIRTSARAWTGTLGDSFSMMIRASRTASDGFIEHSASDISSAMITGIWSAPSNRLRINFITGKEKTGISWWGVPSEILPENRRYNPAGEYTDSNGVLRYYDDETDNYQQNHYNLFFTHLFSGRLWLSTALHFTTGKGFYEEQKSDRKPGDYGLSGLTDNGSPVTSTDIVQRKWLDNNFYGTVWSLTRQGSLMELTLGGALNRYDGDHFGKILWMEYPGNIYPGYEWYRNNGLKDEFNIYGKVNASLSNSLSAFIDLQYRYISYRFSGPDDDMKDLAGEFVYGFFNPKGGIFWRNDNGSEAYVSVAAAHREPTRTDFKDAAGDKAATPGRERLIDYEGGYSFRNALLSASLNCYFMQYKDQLIPTGRISNTGYPVMTNVPQSYRAGIEFSGNCRPLSSVAIAFNATVSRNRIKNFRNYYFNYNTSDWSKEYTYTDLGTVDIAYSPRFTGSAEIEVNPVKDLSLRLTGKYVGMQYFDNTMNKDRAIDPYFVSNFTAAYKMSTVKAGEITLRLMINNILNAKYENNAYGGMWTEDGIEKTWAYFFPQAGINYNAGVSFSF